MNQDQLDSLIRSICKIVGGVLVAHGATQMAAVINTPDVIEAIGGIVMAGISMYGSHSTHSDAPAPAPSAQPQQKTP